MGDGDVKSSRFYDCYDPWANECCPSSTAVDMVNKCCAPGCRGNYRTGPRVTVFQFPKDDDLQKSWLRTIGREDFVPSKHSAVCELHFTDDDIVRERSGVDAATGEKVTVPMSCTRLRPGAVPSRFCPANLISEEKRADMIASIKDLADYVRIQQKSAFWHVIEGNERLIMVHIVEDEVPWINYSVIVKANLTLTFHVVKTPVTRLLSDLRVPTVVKTKSAVMDFLESIEKWDCKLLSSSESLDQEICKTIQLLFSKLSTRLTEDSIKFLSEQLKLLSTRKEQRHYSLDFMVFSCIFFTIAPHAYKYIRSYGSITLPHPTTIRSVCSSFGMNPQPEQQSATFLSYVAKRFSDLEDQQCFVTVVVDEVHIEPYFQYKGGNVTLESTGVASSVLVFMVQSLTCLFREVVHMAPVQKADAQFLHKLLRDVICGLEKIGFKVACVVTHNNPVNRKAMSHFTSPPTHGIVYPHPFDPARPLFFVLDPAHILKCIRDNWLDQSNDHLCFYFPEFEAEPTRARHVLSASFETIREAYDLQNEHWKFRHKMSKEALHPSNTDRQSLKLALQIFNYSLPMGLRSLGVRYNKSTAMFVEIIVKWWKIVNMEIGARPKKNHFKDATYSFEDDPDVEFLNKLLDWLDEWKSKDLDGGTLTKDTHAALQQTTHALVEVTRYCFTELKLPFVLLGKIQVGSLDERLGRYRLMSESQYHASVRQLYKGDNELGLQNALSSTAAACTADSDGDEQWENLHNREHAPQPGFDVAVTEEKLSKVEDILPVLVYVAGYAAHATLKRLDCAKCKSALLINKEIAVSVLEQHRKLVKELDKGGLLFPTMFALNAVVYGYIIVDELSKQARFSMRPKQRQIVMDLALELLTNEESSDFDACENGHTSELLLKHVLWCGTDILFKSFCSKVNDETAVNDETVNDETVVAKPKKSRKRKAKEVA